MPVYQVTFRSGGQQLFEMSESEADSFRSDLEGCWHDVLDELQHPTTPYVVTSTGAAVVLSEVVGFQHYISPEYARMREEEDNEI